MVRLWSGDIDSARGALQVLLLVDYICDWARDKFRESTIRSLAALSRSDRQGTLASDIFSLRAPTATPVPTMRPGTIDEATATPRRVDQAGTGRESDCSPQAYLHPDGQEMLDSLPLHQSPVRDIRFVTSRSRGVLITEENVEMLHKSSSDELFLKYVMKILLTLQSFGFATTWGGLDEAQSAWHNGGNALHPFAPCPVGPKIQSASWQ